MTNPNTARPPRFDRFSWTLTMVFFALGGLWFVSSFFEGSTNFAADTTTSEDGDALEVSSDTDETVDADATAQAAVPDRADSFTISASGDILIHERVGQAAEVSPGVYDFAPLFAPVQNLIASRDFSICHLEVPISSNNQDLSFSNAAFRAPMELPAALKAAGFDSCSLASNHAWDSGESSVTSTIAQLDAVQLPHVGIAQDPEEAAKNWQFNVLGNIIGHLSYTYGHNNPDEANGGVPGYAVSVIDETAILADAARQRAAGSEFIIVSMHWGTEFQNDLTDQQADLGPRLLASPDIDLIIGHHAHVPQRVEEIDGEYIAYGLGNLLSNQSSSAPECPNLCTIDSQDGVLLDFVVERSDAGTLTVTEVVANPTWVDVGGTWKIISTDNPPPVGVDFDATVLQESGARTRATLQVS